MVCVWHGFGDAQSDVLVVLGRSVRMQRVDAAFSYTRRGWRGHRVLSMRVRCAERINRSICRLGQSCVGPEYLEWDKNPDLPWKRGILKGRHLLTHSKVRGPKAPLSVHKRTRRYSAIITMLSPYLVMLGTTEMTERSTSKPGSRGPPDLQNILRQSYDYLTIMPNLRSTYDKLTIIVW